MKLYVCWGLFRSPRPGGHPCRNAHEALKEAGWNPDVEKVYGWGLLGDSLNPTRAKIRNLTGEVHRGRCRGHHRLTRARLAHGGACRSRHDRADVGREPLS